MTLIRSYLKAACGLQHTTTLAVPTNVCAQLARFQMRCGEPLQFTTLVCRSLQKIYSVIDLKKCQLQGTYDP